MPKLTPEEIVRQLTRSAGAEPGNPRKLVLRTFNPETGAMVVYSRPINKFARDCHTEGEK